MTILHKKYTNIAIVFAAAVLFIPFLGNHHLLDGYETIFAEAAREMLVTGNYLSPQINFEPMPDMPPLFIWMQAISMNIFGISEFSARLPNALAGIITLVLLFWLGQKFFSTRFGLFWVIAFAGSFLTSLYFKSGLAAPWNNLFIFLSIVSLIVHSSLSINFYYQRLQMTFLAGVSLGLAMLTQGPLAAFIVLFSLATFMMVRRTWRLFSTQEALLFSSSILAIVIFWAFSQSILYGSSFVKDFFLNDVSVFLSLLTHKTYFYHWLIIIAGSFPASIFVIKALRKFYSDNVVQNNFRVWMIICLSIIFIFFSFIEVGSHHYLSFSYFPISFLAAYTLHKASHRRVYFRRFIPRAALVIGGTISFFFIAVPLTMKFKSPILEALAHHVNNDFTYALLAAEVEWSGWEVIPAILYLIAIVLFFKYFHTNIIKWSLILFFATILVMQSFLLTIMPKIELQVQGAKIEFYKSVAHEQATIKTYGFTSHASLFYGNAQPTQAPKKPQADLIKNPVQKNPTYLSTKVTHKRRFEEDPDFEELYEKNGYVFYKKLK
ncbi:glycosyltransferase family 39 protein [Cytophagaceae bacterium ABcell3]|nr:glycosyltransferase family 39 protein [Cytophagaceae bacterium ABcell3]